MGAQRAGRWHFLGVPRARGVGSGHLNLGTRRGPPQRQLPDRRCTSLYNSPGGKVTPASRTWGLGLSCVCSQPSPTPSSPGWTEGKAILVLSLSPPQHPVPGDQHPPCIRCWALPVPESPAPAGPPPGYPGLTQNCPHRHIQPRTLATLGGRTWPPQPSLSARGSLTLRACTASACRQLPLGPGGMGHSPTPGAPTWE